MALEEDSSILIRLWPLVMAEVADLEKESTMTITNKFLTKCLKLLSDGLEIPGLPLNASNEMCRVLLFDINSLPWRQSDKDAEGQLQDYLLRERGWKLLRLLLYLKAKNLSYEHELAKILSSILNDLVELPNVESNIPPKIKLLEESVNRIKIDCEAAPLSSLVTAKSKLMKMERKKHSRKYKRTKYQSHKSEGDNATATDDNSDSDDNQPPRISAIPPVLPSPVTHSRNPFEYYSHQYMKSEPEELETNDLEDDKLNQIISEWDEDVPWTISPVDLSKIVIDLLVIIFNQYNRNRLPESHVQSFVDEGTELFYCLLSPNWKPKDWSSEEKDQIRHLVLNLLYCVSSALISCLQKNCDSFKNTIEILLSLCSKYLDDSNLSPSLACDTYLASVSLAIQYVKRCHVYEEQNFFLDLMRLFTNIKFCKLANKILVKNNEEEKTFLSLCTKEFVKLSQYALMKFRNFSSKLVDNPPARYLDCHHHAEILGKPLTSCSREESLCVITSYAKSLLGMFGFLEDPAIRLSILEALGLGGICCCITPAGIVEGFRTIFEPNMKNAICFKSLLVMETLIENLTRQTCQYCDLTATWTDEAWLTNYWSFYKNLFLSVQCSRSNNVCHYLLKLIEKKPAEHKIYILNYVAAPLFEKGRLNRINKIENETIEYALVVLSKLLESKILVDDFLKVFSTEQFETLLEENNIINQSILDILKYIILATSKDFNPACTCDEIHAGAKTLLNKVLISCDVNFFLNAIEKRELAYEECIEDLEYTYKAWAICKDLLRCNGYRSHFLSSPVLSVVYKLFLEILEHFQKESKCENPDSNCPDIKIVQLLEATLSVCLNLVPFYDISEAKQITEQEILKLTEQSLHEWIPDSIKKLRHLYDSLFNCFLGEFQSHFATASKKWTLHSLDISLTESFLADITCSESDDGITTDVFYNGDVDTDEEVGEHNSKDCAKDHKKIIYPSLLNLTLRLLTDHIEKLALSSHDAAGRLEIALHVVQRLNGLSQNEGQRCARILKQEGALQMIYRLLSCSSSYTTLDPHEFKQSLIKLWSSVVIKAGINTSELFNYLKLFSGEYSSILSLLLDGFCSVLENSNREAAYSVKFPIQLSPANVQFNFEKFGITNPDAEVNLGDIDFSISENISLDLPLILWHVLGRRTISYNPETDKQPEAPWNVVSAIMPLVQDSDWFPRHKNGFSVSMWIKMDCQASKESSLDNQHILSIGSDFWLMQIWLDFKLHSFTVFITEATKMDYVSFKKLDFDKSLELEPNRWHHLVVTYNEIENSKAKCSDANITLILDGFLASKPKPKFRLNRSKKNSKASYILMGHAPDTDIKSTSNVNSYELGNIFLFKSLVLDLSHCFLLYHMGPDQDNLTEGLLDEKSRNFLNLFTNPKHLDEFLVSNIDIGTIERKSEELLQSLREHFFAAYNPRQPLNYLVYPHVMDLKEMFLPLVKSSNPSNFRVMVDDKRPTQRCPIDFTLTPLGKFHHKEHQSLLDSINHLGGGNLFAFLFAKMVEMSDDEEFQTLSLRLVLKLLNKTSKNQTRDYLFSKQTNFNLSSASFEEMLKFVFENTKCLSKSKMLRVLVNESLSSPILSGDSSKKGDSSDLIERSNSVILNPWILAMAISSWNALEKTDNCRDLITLYQALNVLIRDKHPYQKFNIKQMIRVDVVKRITFFLKEKVLYSQTKIPRELGTSLSNLIRNLLGSPPDPDLLELVWGCAIVLHPQDCSFIYFQPGMTYFTIPITHNSDVFKSKMASVQSSASSEGLNTIEEESKEMLSDSGIDDEALNSKISKIIKNLKIKDGAKIIDDSQDQIALKTFGSSSVKSEIANTPKQGSMNDDNLPEIEELDGDILFGEGEGLQAFVCNLYDLLYEFLVTLSDSVVYEILPLSFNFETMLLLSNHPHKMVRCSILNLLGAFIQRTSFDQVDTYLKANGFQLLANQIHQYPVNQNIIDACAFLALRHIKDQQNITPEEFGQNTTLDLLPEQVYSTITILGILINTSDDLALSRNTLGLLTQTIQIVRGVTCVLVENGLIEVISSFIIKVTHKNYRETDIVGEIDIIFEDLLTLVKLIGKQLVRLSNTLESACNLLTNGITQLTMSYIQSLEQCGPESSCVNTFRNCICALISESLLSMEQSLESVGFATVKFPLMLSPYTGRILSRTELSHVASVANIPLFEPHGTSAFWNARWDASKRSSSFSGNLPVSDISPAEILEKYCQLVSVASDFLTHREPNCVISTLELNFSTKLLTRMLDELEGNLATSEETKFFRRVSVLKDTSSELSKLLLWLLSPYSSINKRLEVVDLVVGRWKHEEIIGAVLRHMTQHVSQQFLSFLYDLLYNLERLDSSDGKDQRTKPSFCQNIYQLIEDVIKWYGRSMTVLDNEIIEKAIHIWYESAYRDRCLWHAKIRINARRLQHNLSQLEKELAANAIGITSQAVDHQYADRKSFMADLKRSLGRKMEAEKCWHFMVERLTHERSIWHDPASYPISWQLDPTEGPQRVRRRLQRCQLKIAPRFFLPEFKEHLKIDEHPQPLSYLLDEDNSSSGTAALVERLHSDERIIYHCTCMVITPALEITGEILVGEKCIHFVREKNHVPFNGLGSHPAQVWPFEDILEVQFRRFQLKDSALEIFLTSGHTHLVAFPSPKARDDFWQQLVTNSLPNMIAPDHLSTFTERWRQRQLTNFEYLTQLNKLAGRSFNDLMQYPVFPFILSNYTEDELDLHDPSSYRDLSKPMAVQDPNKEQRYVDLYKVLKEEHERSKGTNDMLMPNQGPYHYGSHYSNSGTVLHFLVRMPPFTQMFLTYQDRNFDIPDRTFHSLQTSWRLASGDSSTDVKELIPEFFFLPEIFINREGFNFGVRQSGERVNHIILPPWCRNDARMFVLIHRQALESDHVRSHINKWIDLVFGFKQTGKAAVEAINLFHPSTYYGIDVSNIDDPLTRNAILTMIRTFGQMPKQLFQSPHAACSGGQFQFLTNVTTKELASINKASVLKEVKGLKWGSYVGSPNGPIPLPILTGPQKGPIGSLVPILTNDVYGIAPNSCLLLSYSKEKGVLNTIFVTSASLITWGHVDGVVRIKLKRDSSPTPLLANKSSDPVTLCATIPDCNLVFIGRTSGVIDVYTLEIQSNTVIQKGLSISLLGHRSKITSLSISKAFNVVASGGQDGAVIVWDLNSLNYIRTLPLKKDPITKLCISDTLGDIASASLLSGTCQSCLTVHTLNGNLVGQVTLPNPITALCYSSAPEGLSVNVIATGLSNGMVFLWSSWNLECVRELRQDAFTMPISCLSFTTDNQYLFISYLDGPVLFYHKNGRTNRSPRFLTVF